jgi:hypothetical protein
MTDPNGWPSVCKCGATAVSPCNRAPCFRGERDPGRVYNEAEVAALVAEARAKALEEAAPVIEAARCIRHWHDREPDGMVVSAEHVRALWAALDQYDAIRALKEAPHE